MYDRSFLILIAVVAALLIAFGVTMFPHRESAPAPAAAVQQK